MRVLVTGATGFVGGHVVDRLLEHEHVVKCLVRSPDNVGRLAAKAVELVQGDLTDSSRLVEAAAGVDAAIHLVGIIRERPRQSFESVHVEGTRNVVEGLKEAGVRRLIHMSALGSQHDAVSEYHKTKWRAEEIVRESGLDFTIFRPSIIFGRGDGFTARIVDLVRNAPVIPIIGSGQTPYQPVSAEDVSFCFATALENDQTIGQAYELCGPDIITFEDYLNLTMAALGIRKPKVHIPAALMSPVVTVLQSVFSNPPLTRDELVMSQESNTCSANAVVDVFGRTPVRLQDAIHDIVHS